MSEDYLNIMRPANSSHLDPQIKAMFERLTSLPCKLIIPTGPITLDKLDFSPYAHIEKKTEDRRITEIQIMKYRTEPVDDTLQFICRNLDKLDINHEGD